MNFVSLFAGVGGFDLALERSGMDCVGQVEIDAKCREVLHKHWPHVPKWADIKEVDGGWLGSVDVLCGGFPCQDYSVAGLRGGLAGDRGALWWQFHRLIAECRPRWVVGENVPGLLSSNSGRDFGAIVGSLVELGYGVVWRVLDAQYFGVAQRRRRVFIVGHIGGIPRPEILAFAEGCSGDTPPRRRPGERVAPSLANRAKGGGGLGTDVELDGGLVAKSVLTKAGNRYDPFSDNLIPTRRMHDPDREGFAQTVTARTGARYDPETETLIAFDWTKYGANGNDLSPTIRVGSSLDIASPPAIASAAGVRRLTPLECERLQGFPDNWTVGQSDTQRYRQMGNAVAVPVVEWIGKNLSKAEASR